MNASGHEIGRNTIFDRLLAIVLNPWFLTASTAVLLLVVSLELASLRDEAIWMYSAWIWAADGDPPYVGSFENKPAGIFLLYRLSYALFGLNLWPVRLLGIAAMLGVMLLLYVLGRRYEGRFAGAMAALIFGLAMANRLTDGYVLAFTEPFMILFTTLTFFFLSDRQCRTTSHFVRGILFWPAWVVGALLGAALAFKQIAVVDVLGLAPFYWVTVGSRRPRLAIVGDLLQMAMAAAAVTALSVWPLLASGVSWADYWRGAWGILFHQVGSLPISERTRLIASTWTDPAMMVFYPPVIVFLFQKKPLQKAGVPFWCLLFWLGMDFLGVNASNVYRHHLKQIMVPLSLIAGLGLGQLVRSIPSFTSRGVFCLYLCVVAVMAPLNSFLVGTAHCLMFYPDIPEVRASRQVADHLRRCVSPSQYVYIWAINSHPIHLYAQRRSPCRYFNAIFHFVPDFEQTTAMDLTSHPPQAIVIEDRGEHIVPPPHCVQKLLSGPNYSPTCRIDGFQIFERTELPH